MRKQFPQPLWRPWLARAWAFHAKRLCWRPRHPAPRTPHSAGQHRDRRLRNVQGTGGAERRTKTRPARDAFAKEVPAGSSSGQPGCNFLPVCRRSRERRWKSGADAPSLRSPLFHRIHQRIGEMDGQHAVLQLFPGSALRNVNLQCIHGYKHEQLTEGC